MTNYNVNKKALYISANIIRKQLLLGSFCVILSVFSLSMNVVLSALCGFILVFIPTLVYIKISNMKKIIPVYQVYIKHQKAEIAKFLLNLVGFILVFTLYKQVHIWVFFATYVVTLSSYWVSLFTRDVKGNF